MISSNYKIIEKIREGSFGAIFKCENIRTNELVAIKFEEKYAISKTLKNEARIYQYLGKIDGFPQLKMFGSTQTHNYLVVNLLGESLAKMIQYYKALSLKTVLLLGIQIISRVQTLHSKHLLHRDIKPDNFLFGINSSTNKLFLIDFGFSKRYNYDGDHILEQNISKIIGTPNFVSLNIHKGIEPSRRDDIESCIYILLNMLFGKLEWFNKTNNTEIELLKSNILKNPDIPPFINVILSYVRSMKFDETPNYDYIIKLMVNEVKENGYKQDYIYDWS
jgi:hypothetical protein